MNEFLIFLCLGAAFALPIELSFSQKFSHFSPSAPFFCSSGEASGWAEATAGLEQLWRPLSSGKGKEPWELMEGACCKTLDQKNEMGMH